MIHNILKFSQNMINVKTYVKKKRLMFQSHQYFNLYFAQIS